MRVVLMLGLLLAVSACARRSVAPTVPGALEVGTPFTVFAATTRTREDDGTYGTGRANKLGLLELTVSIPPDRAPGTLNLGYGYPNPNKDFTMAGREVLPSASIFNARIAKVLRRLPRDRQEVTVFVHGYNTTQVETVFRAAQFANDIQLPGALVVYSWPSLGKTLGYVYDSDSVLFARDGLEQLLYQLTSVGALRILLIAHSMGGVLAMETLRQIDIAKPGWAARNLGGVVLVSPDLDVDLFSAQMLRLKEPPTPFVVFLSGKDTLLGLSSRLRGTSNSARLGNLKSAEAIADLPIEIVDTSAFAGDALSPHFIPATSPALLAMLKGASSVSQTFGRDAATVESLFDGSHAGTHQTAVYIRLPADEGPR
jgi:esterase/lipase superfamily enzyme